MTLRIAFATCVIILFSTECVHAQVSLYAMVADSATFKPMPGVTIRINKSLRGTITNERGYFVLDVSESDSLTFSSVGYFTKTVRASQIKNVAVVYLTEAPQLLKVVTIEGTIGIPWLPKIPPEKLFRNPGYDSHPGTFPNQMGFQGFQTFGPGYVFKGPFSRFNRDEREKKKFVRIQKENENAKGYVALVNDPEVKGKLMKDYNLTEDDYYKLLARFNEKYRDSIYRLEDVELTTLIFLFFAENTKK